MNEKLQTKLYRKYPKIFQDRKKPGSETRMCDGICCDDGWYDIIDHICQQLDFIRVHFGVVVSFFQVKEKFAGLRLYINAIKCDNNILGLSKKEKWIIDGLIRDLIHRSEDKSYHICEECSGSRYGNKTLGHWVYAMCDDCWAKFIKEKGIKIPNRKKKKK